MKRNNLLRYLFATILSLGAQNTMFYQGNIGDVTLGASTILYIKGGMETYGTLNNGGTVYLTGDLINHTQVQAFGTTGTVVLEDSSRQVLGGEQATEFNKLILNKPVQEVKLARSIKVDSSLQMIDGDVDLDTCHIILRDYLGLLQGETAENKIYTQTTGKLKARVVVDPLQSNKNLAGIGLVVDIPNTSLGSTEIERGHTAFSQVGEGAIGRYFNFNPSLVSTSVGDIKSVKMAYFADEIMNLTADEGTLELYHKDSIQKVWKSKGGVVDVAHDTVVSTAVYSLPSYYNIFTAAPSGNKESTCTNSDKSYIRIRYLVASEAFEGDTVYFINLSSSEGGITKHLWSFGDGGTASIEDVSHIYKGEGSYIHSLEESNLLCSNKLSKTILIKKDGLRKEAQDDPSRVFVRPIACFPNPTSDFLYFDTELNTSLLSNLALVDPQGKYMLQKEYTQSKISELINFSNLANGIYLLKFSVLDKSYTYKILKY